MRSWPLGNPDLARFGKWDSKPKEEEGILLVSSDFMHLPNCFVEKYWMLGYYGWSPEKAGLSITFGLKRRKKLLLLVASYLRTSCSQKLELETSISPESRLRKDFPARNLDNPKNLDLGLTNT